MSRYARPMLPVLFGLAAVLLGSCGGGGGGGSSEPPPAPPPPPCAPIIDSAGNSIACEDPFWLVAGGGGGGGADGDSAGADGTAGDGRAIAGATVTLTDFSGNSRSATTDAQGYYRINITRFTPPFVVKLVTADGEQRHHSFSTQPVKKRGFITINITGLTDKLASDVARAAGGAGARDLTPAIVNANADAITTARTNLTNAIRNQITAAGLAPDTFDPIANFFRPNLQGHDLVLETVAAYLDNNDATQVVPKAQSACTAPRRWSAGANLCSPTNSPGFIASGSTVKLTDSIGALVGTADFACNNGTLTPVGTPTCAAPVIDQPCSAPAASWSVSGSACNADTAPGTIASGQSLTLTDSQSPTTGSITYACSNGNLAQTGTPTCTTAAPKSCAAPAATWTVSGQSCQSNGAPSTMNSGTQQTLQDSIGTVTGSIVYACNDGALSVQGTPTCVAASLNCAAPPSSWTASGSTCTSDTPAQPLTNGQTVQLKDTTAPTVGDVTWSCSQGQLQLKSAPRCQTAQPVQCAAPPAEWQAGNALCNSDTTPAPFNAGSSVTLVDNTGQNVGSISYTCSSSGALSVSGTPSCAPSTTATCSTQSLATDGWVVGGGNVCKPDAAPSSIPSGTTLVLEDTVAPTTGQITVQCTSGKLETVGVPTCNAPPQEQPCSVSVSSWTQSEYTCTPDSSSGTVVIPSGSSFTWIDGTNPVTGSHTLACSNGSTSVVNSNCTFTGTSSAPMGKSALFGPQPTPVRVRRAQ